MAGGSSSSSPLNINKLINILSCTPGDVTGALQSQSAGRCDVVMLISRFVCDMLLHVVTHHGTWIGKYLLCYITDVDWSGVDTLLLV